MTEQQKKIENKNNNNPENKESKSNYIKQERYEKIKQCQEAIFEATHISLSVKRVINELITEDNLQKIEDKFIQLFRG
jgi:flagellar biosynthesis component FlhA